MGSIACSTAKVNSKLNGKCLVNSMFAATRYCNLIVKTNVFRQRRTFLMIEFCFSIIVPLRKVPGFKAILILFCFLCPTSFFHSCQLFSQRLIPTRAYSFITNFSKVSNSSRIFYKVSHVPHGSVSPVFIDNSKIWLIHSHIITYKCRLALGILILIWRNSTSTWKCNLLKMAFENETNIQKITITRAW